MKFILRQNLDWKVIFYRHSFVPLTVKMILLSMIL
jgi:hypothetical protein